VGRLAAVSIVALDVGTKRIGVAVADAEATFAFPAGTIERTNLNRDLAAICEYVERYGASDLVVGDPLTLAGERGVAAADIDRFVDKLRSHFSGRIHRVDERMTTAQATRTLIAADVSRRKRKKAVDALAATLILETFLARRRNTDAS
jgi:putative holliday junction resolvase